ncbi:unnamed protein product [Heterobilharzia americana]|nr:unnamed protein product [Heterobilharzia americana]
MYRRQQFDRLNPRNVLPSRHTLFIRGLPGSTDVAKVKDFFSNETNSRCSVEFFSTSEDKKRFSVAIRFKSHEIASEMLRRHNGKTMFGYPVELTWFKDLKKARAKMFEEQRQARRFPQNNRGFRGPERRSIQSPGNYGDNRRIRTGSSSSGGRGYRDNGRDRRSIDRRSLDRRSVDRRSTDGRSIDRQSTDRRSVGRHSTDRRTVSRSRSFTGSSSRSASRSAASRSRSASHARHSLPSNPGDSMNASESEFNGRNYDDRRISRNRSRHSRDPSSSSSRSSEEGRRQSSSNHHSESRNNARYGQSGGENSSPDYQARKNQRLSRSPSMNEENLAFSNAPAPNPEGGSSLVSGLIQLRRRGQQGFEQSPVRGGSFSRRNRNSSENSSSGASVDSSTGAFESPRNHAGRKRVHSISPPYNDVSNRNTKTKAEAASNSDEKGQSVIEPQKRRKVKNTRSPANNTVESLRERPNTRSKAQRASLRKTDVESSATMRQANASRKHRSSAEKSSQKSSTKDSSPAPDKTTSKSGHNSRRSETTRSPLSTFSSKTAKRWRTPEDEVSDDQPRKGEKWPVTTNKTGKTKGKSSIPPANNSSDNDHFDASKIGGNQLTSSGGKDTKTTESLMPIPVTSNSTSSNDNTGSAAVVSGTATVTNKELGSGDRPDDIVNLIRDRKDALAEDYKRDCEAFTTVVRMLISITWQYSLPTDKG